MNPISPEPYLDAIPSVLSPLGVVAFAMVCCTIALAAASCFTIRDDKSSFKWVIHAFLAIFGAFVLMAIFCPSSVLTIHERVELAKVNASLHDNPWVVLIGLAVGLGAYMAYHWGTEPRGRTKDGA